MYPLIDSHAHLEELSNLESAIKRAKDRGVIAIIAVGSDYESNHQVLEIAERFSSFVYPALGLHPWSLAAQSSRHHLQFIEDNIASIVAIGEVGLDYHKELLKSASKDNQQSILRSLLELARRYDKPAIIHSRYAWRDALTLVEEARVNKAVFHWYTGPLNVLREAQDKGYLASATLAAEYHEEHKRAIREVPLESLLLETDSPVVYREHKSEPADVTRVLNAVAKLKDSPPSIVADKTTENALSFYRISHFH
jgi:TatD DNase family protein